MIYINHSFHNDFFHRVFDGSTAPCMRAQYSHLASSSSSVSLFMIDPMGTMKFNKQPSHSMYIPRPSGTLHKQAFSSCAAVSRQIVCTINDFSQFSAAISCPYTRLCLLTRSFEMCRMLAYHYVSPASCSEV